MSCFAQIVPIYGTFMELPASQMRKMETKMEVSKPELYYIAKFRVRKYRKGIVCGIVAYRF